MKQAASYLSEFELFSEKDDDSDTEYIMDFIHTPSSNSPPSPNISASLQHGQTREHDSRPCSEHDNSREHNSHPCSIPHHDSDFVHIKSKPISQECTTTTPHDAVTPEDSKIAAYRKNFLSSHHIIMSCTCWFSNFKSICL